MASITATRRRAQQMLDDARSACDEAQTRRQDTLLRHQREETELRARHQRESTEAERALGEARVRFETLESAFRLFDELTEADEGQTRPSARRRGRAMSSDWLRWLSNLPVAPAEGWKGSPFIDMVVAERPEMSRSNVRSQLHHFKRRRVVEYVDKRYRLTRPLDTNETVSVGNEDDSPDANPFSEDEAPEGSDQTSGASDVTDPFAKLNRAAE